jgi:hypothetical protein
MYQKAPNRTDQAVNDFFHSRLWKVILTIFLSAMGLAFLCVCSTLVFSALGITIPILGILGNGSVGR